MQKLWMEAVNANLFESLPRLEIPIYFFKENMINSQWPKWAEISMNLFKLRIKTILTLVSRLTGLI